MCNFALSFPVIPKQPSLKASPNQAFIESGKPLTLECQNQSSGALMTYLFLKDSVAVANLNQSSSTFKIPNLSTKDTGNYSCIVTISGVNSTASSMHSVTVMGMFHYTFAQASKKCNLCPLNFMKRLFGLTCPCFLIECCL